MEFDKTSWSCPWNTDQNCTQNSARDVGVVLGVVVRSVRGLGVSGLLGSGECQTSRGVEGVRGLGRIRGFGV